MREQVIQQAEACPLYQAALLALGKQLPVEPDELDALVERVVEERRDHAFTSIVLSALAAGRPVQARHLIKGARLFQDVGHLIGAAWNMSGDICTALVTAIEEGNLPLEQEGVALLVAALWHQRQAPETSWPLKLVSQARLFARRTLSDPVLQVEAAALADVMKAEESLRAIVAQAPIPVDQSIIRNVSSTPLMCLA